jgi:hypothetical protein
MWKIIMVEVDIYETFGGSTWQINWPPYFFHKKWGSWMANAMKFHLRDQGSNPITNFVGQWCTLTIYLNHVLIHKIKIKIFKINNN